MAPVPNLAVELARQTDRLVAGTTQVLRLELITRLLQSGVSQSVSHVFLFISEVRYLYNMMVDADISRKCDNSQLPFVFVLIKTLCLFVSTQIWTVLLIIPGICSQHCNSCKLISLILAPAPALSVCSLLLGQKKAS